MAQKTFTVCGKNIVISNTYDLYNTLRGGFYQRAYKDAGEFEQVYNNYKNIDRVIENAYRDGMSIIGRAINDLVINEILIRMKIYDYDIEGFFNEFYREHYFIWEECFNDVEEKFLSIIAEQQQLDEYRTMRRENRGRWVGGGFGIGGAIKGAMKAGAMNMVTGAAHGLFNLGAKAISKAGEVGQKLSLYDESKNVLCDGIFQSVFNIHYACWDMITRLDDSLEKIEYFTPNSSKKAQALINNFSKMSREEVRENFSKALLLDPYNQELYKNLLSILGDSDGGLERIANYFNIDTSFISCSKEALTENLFTKIGGNLQKSEHEALNVREKFSMAIKSNGLEGTKAAKKILSKIDGVIEDFDKKAKTVNGQIFATREEADSARQEFTEINNILSLDYKHSEINAREVLTKLENYNSQFPEIKNFIDENIAKVKESIQLLDKEARTITAAGQKIILDTREEAEKIKNNSQLEELDRRYKAYTDEKANYTASELEKIAEILKNAPDKIKSIYIDLLKKFADKQREIILTCDFASIKNSLYWLALAFVIITACAVYAALHPDKSDSYRSIAIITMFIITFIARFQRKYKTGAAAIVGRLTFAGWAYYFVSCSISDQIAQRGDLEGAKSAGVIFGLLMLYKLYSAKREYNKCLNKSHKAGIYINDLGKFFSESE